MLRCGLAVVLALCLHVSSHAGVIAWQFEGEFTIFGTDYVDAGLSIGDKLFGRVLFSSDTPDLQPESDVIGTYEAILGMVMVPSLGSHWTFAGPNNTQRILVLNDNPQEPPFDFFEIFFRDTSFDTVLPNPDRLFFIVGTASTGLFPDDSLPSSPPAVDAFFVTHPLLFQYTDISIVDGASATGIITRITRITRLPEPSTLLLVALSLIGLGFVTRRAL